MDHALWIWCRSQYGLSVVLKVWRKILVRISKLLVVCMASFLWCTDIHIWFNKWGFSVFYFNVFLLYFPLYNSDKRSCIHLSLYRTHCTGRLLGNSTYRPNVNNKRENRLGPLCWFHPCGMAARRPLGQRSHANGLGLYITCENNITYQNDGMAGYYRWLTQRMIDGPVS